MITPKSTKPHILIGVCNSQDHIPSKFFWSFVSNLLTCPYPVTIAPGGHPWDAVRNNAVIQIFLNSSADIFVKMDIDQVYPERYFESMVPLVGKYKVIGPLIFDRWPSNRFMPLLMKSHFGPHLTKYVPPSFKGVQEVPYNHTNLFYKREVLEAIQHDRPWYDPHIRPDGLDRMNHLDYTFLDKIKKAGYAIYTNFDVVVKHIASLPIGKEEFLLFNQGEANVRSEVLEKPLRGNDRSGKAPDAG